MRKLALIGEEYRRLGNADSIVTPIKNDDHDDDDDAGAGHDSGAVGEVAMADSGGGGGGGVGSGETGAAAVAPDGKKTQDGGTTLSTFLFTPTR